MKTENSKNIDRLFKEKLKNAEYSVDPKTTVVFQYNLKKKKRIITYLYFTALSIILLTIGALLIWQNYFNTEEQQSTSVVSSASKNTTTTFRKAFSEKNINKNFIAKTEPNANINSKNYIKEKHITNIPTSLNKKQLQNPNISQITVSTEKENNEIINQKKEEEQQNIKAGVSVMTYISSSAKTNFYLNDKKPPEPIINTYLINENVNSVFHDYAPVINADGSTLFFTSRRLSNSNDKKGKRKKEEWRETIFMAHYDKTKNQWTKAVPLPEPINKELTNASAVGVSNDGQQLFIYQDDSKGNGDIYISKLNGNNWSELQKLPEPINTKYLETTVSLSPDGNTLFIASNRPGGYGGLDLWYATKNKDGFWSTPVNLGPEINSKGNEEGVYIHPDGKTIYFHSNGHPGYGGYDIFYSVLQNGKWSKPINMGDKINGPDDDVYFVIDAQKKNGYYASKKKNGIGETDIYQVSFTYPEPNKSSSLTLFKGKVLDKTDKKPLEATIEIIDLDKNQTINTLTSNSATGNFMMSLPAGKNYAININKKGYLFYSESFLIDSVTNYNEVEKIIFLDKLVSGAKIVLNNIFYDYNKATLREQSKIELDKVYELMIQNPKLKIEFSAHTDSRGSNEYNLNLSQQRANSCRNYLIQKGISPERIIAKGYGEQQLVVTDKEIEMMNSPEEKEAAHQKNRRTEIKIIENE